MRGYTYETYRIDWLCEVYAVDQYGMRPNTTELYYSMAHPTRELALADLEIVSKPHPYVEGRRVSTLCGHQYHECGVRSTKVRVSTYVGEI